MPGIKLNNRRILYICVALFYLSLFIYRKIISNLRLCQVANKIICYYVLLTVVVRRCTMWAKSTCAVINYILYSYFWPTLYMNATAFGMENRVVLKCHVTNIVIIFYILFSE